MAGQPLLAYPLSTELEPRAGDVCDGCDSWKIKDIQLIDEKRLL